MSRIYSPFRGIKYVSLSGYSKSKYPAQLFIKFRLFHCLISRTKNFLFEEIPNRVFQLPVCYASRHASLMPILTVSPRFNLLKLIELQKHIIKLTIEKLNKHEKSSYYFETRLRCFCCSHIDKPFSGNPNFFSNYPA